MKRRKVSAVTRKHTHNGDSGRSMGLKASTNGTNLRQLGFGTIGRVLYPLSTPQTKRSVLSSAVRSAVADMKK